MGRGGAGGSALDRGQLPLQFLQLLSYSSILFHTGVQPARYFGDGREGDVTEVGTYLRIGEGRKLLHQVDGTSPVGWGGENGLLGNSEVGGQKGDDLIQPGSTEVPPGRDLPLCSD
jgi:hypothetical protein